MPQVPDKATLKAELVASLEAALESARRAHGAAIEGATHAEARAENPKDTRGLEQSYLARGQAQRIAELEAGVAQVVALEVRAFGARDRIAIGALVTLEEDGAEQLVWLAPHGGGTTLAGAVQVITPSSPFGRTLLGKRAQDEVEIQLPGRIRSLVIVAVA